jgi:hypothetical protein
MNAPDRPNPREEAERLFVGMSGAEWNRNAAISGVGYAYGVSCDLGWPDPQPPGWDVDPVANHFPL